jgi:hypothetical protein
VVPRRYRLEYKSAAAPAARLTGRAWSIDTGWSYRLEDERGQISLGGRLETKLHA